MNHEKHPLHSSNLKVGGWVWKSTEKQIYPPEGSSPGLPV